MLLYKCLAKMEYHSSGIRSCYSSRDGVGLEDEELAELMLLDGCFILRFLLEVHDHRRGLSSLQQMRKYKAPIVDDGGQGSICPTMGEELGAGYATQGPLPGISWVWQIVDYDLLKLENQIPFFVLEELFGMLKTPEEGSISLIDLALEHFGYIEPESNKNFKAQSGYAHLLHLFYSTRLPSSAVHGRKIINKYPELDLDEHWVPCATELERAGVKFHVNMQGSCFLDISFVDGVLKIPFFYVSDSTNSLVRNLIAFEQCYPRTSALITTYAIFMDCLVDTAKDVSLLRLNGILMNHLSSDEAAADLFNKLTNQIHCSRYRNYFRDIFLDVNQHRRSKWHKYRAGLMRDHFRSPWAIISVIAAIVLLILTGLQTFYTVYAYYFSEENG